MRKKEKQKKILSKLKNSGYLGGILPKIALK
jgi:hypothetical protein